MSWGTCSLYLEAEGEAFGVDWLEAGGDGDPVGVTSVVGGGSLEDGLEFE